MIHISCVSKWLGIRKKAAALIRIASLYIRCVLRWLGTNLIAYGLWHTASLEISCVLSQSGTNAKECGSMHTASLHISWVLNWWGVTIIKFRIISKWFILFYFFSCVRVKFYGQKKWQHAQATPRRSFYRCKKPMKTWLNLRWKMMIQLIKIYLELTNLSMYKQWIYIKSWWFYRYKTYENILKFNF